MKRHLPVLFAVLAAALYALSTPCSKLLLFELPPMMMASLLYLGAGLGMLVVGLIRSGTRRLHNELPLTRRELPYTLGMIMLDIAAPILLMFGLRLTTASNVALLNNFEIVATSLIALLMFKEAIGRRLWFAIGLITVASVLLSFESEGSLSFSVGSLLVLGACVCWGLENNCTRMLSDKDPLQIVIVKGFGSGFGALGIALASGEQITSFTYVPLALLLGFVAYGLSIFFYVHAQRYLGAARTSAYYAIAPFLGAGLSMIVLSEAPDLLFVIALLLMLLGAVLVTIDQNTAQHSDPKGMVSCKSK